MKRRVSCHWFTMSGNVVSDLGKNGIRPHEPLGQKTPDQKEEIPFSRCVPPITNPRRACGGGGIDWPIRVIPLSRMKRFTLFPLAVSNKHFVMVLRLH